VWGTFDRGADADVLEDVPSPIGAVNVVGGSHRRRSPCGARSTVGQMPTSWRAFRHRSAASDASSGEDFGNFYGFSPCSGYTKTAVFAENQRIPRFSGRHTIGILTECRPFVVPLSSLCRPSFRQFVGLTKRAGLCYPISG